MWSAKAEGHSQGVPQPIEPRKTGDRSRITKGTDQQEALWAKLVETDRHIIVEARAGTGKSSSCREGMHRLVETGKKQAIRYAVYNKTAADEFRGACPPSVDVGTVHAFGFAALRRAFGSMVEKNKTYLILDDTPAGKSLPRYMRKSVSMLVSQAKNQAMPPRGGSGADSLSASSRLSMLLAWMEHYDINDYGRPDKIAELADVVLTRSAEWTQVVDYEDMIWLPFVHQVEFPPCDVFFADEVQDFNAVQHALIPLLAKSGRVVGVGDSRQAIYAWRGADPDSMLRLREMLHTAPQGMENLALTLTFRCPKSHVRLANELVPDLEAYESNPEGVIDYRPDVGCILSAQPGDKVICPTNAPVISAAMKIIAARRQAVVKGRAFGNQLTFILRGIKDTRTIATLARGVKDWKGRELLRLADLDGVDDLIESASDRAAGLSAVLSACSSPSEVEPAIAELFVEEFSPDAVNFSTVHRAKGAEADHIWFLDVPSKRPKDKPVSSWEAAQARNLRYVALTRSKYHLTIVQPEGGAR